MPPFYFLTFAKVSVSVSKKFGLKKVSVSVSKTFGLEKKSRYRSRKHLVSKKSLGIGLENIWSRKKVSVSKILVSKKSLGIGLDEIFWSRHSVIIIALFSLHNFLNVTKLWNKHFNAKANTLNQWSSILWNTNLTCLCPAIIIPYLIEKPICFKHII